jgi:hypothetical protein
VIGEKGKLVYGSHGAGGLKLIPESRMREYNEPEPTLPRSPGHHKEWARACKTGKPCGSSFDYGGRLTELALLGLIAIRMKGRRLQWDSVNMRFTNCPEANQYLRSPARAGWEV